MVVCVRVCVCVCVCVCVFNNSFNIELKLLIGSINTIFAKFNGNQTKNEKFHFFQKMAPHGYFPQKVKIWQLNE